MACVSQTADPIAAGAVAVLVPVSDIAAAAALYDLILGPRADADAPVWPVAGGALVLGPPGESASAAFRVAQPEQAGRLLARRGVAVSPQTGPGGTRRLLGAPALGVTDEIPGGPPGAGAVAPAVDHLVFTAAQADEAIALLAGRLGLDLRLVQSFEGLQQLFFRSHEVVVEVIVGDPGDGAQPVAGVSLWGVAWRTGDLTQAHRRLTEAGVALSPIRDGRKNGTRVVTVREPALGIATLLIEHLDR